MKYSITHTEQRFNSHILWQLWRLLVITFIQ